MMDPLAHVLIERLERELAEMTAERDAWRTHARRLVAEQSAPPAPAWDPQL